MTDSQTRDDLLRQLSEIHAELAAVHARDLSTRHQLLTRADGVRGQLARSMPAPTREDRAQIEAELAALRKTRKHHIAVMREERWGTQLPIWLYWLRPFRFLSLENRPSYPVKRRPGDEATKQSGRFWGLPVVTHFQPEIREITRRIAFLEEQLRGRSSPTRRIRTPRRYRHPDDG